jgi:gliding motility-associated lipoprotein GldH
LFTACGSGYTYEEYRQFPAEAGWTYADSVSFDFAISDTNQVYDLHFFVDHAADFGNQNLYVRFHTLFPGGERLTETVSLELADRFGRWEGDCSGETCRVDIPIQQGAYFNRAGAYTLRVEQYSRQDSLPGISGVGFALVPAGRRDGGS